KEGNRLLNILLTTPEDLSSSDFWRLHTMFCRGYDPLRILPALLNENDHIASMAAHLISEMHRLAKPLLPYTLRLLSHRHPRVRGDLVDNLYLADSNDGDAAALVLRLLEDPHDGVRFRALTFVSRRSIAALQSALPIFEREGADRHVAGLTLV